VSPQDAIFCPPRAVFAGIKNKESKMNSKSPVLIGYKHIGLGILSYVIVLLIIWSISGNFSSVTSGAIGIAIMSGSVISAANEGYNRGAQRNTSATEI
jgi:hypothetical protein